MLQLDGETLTESGYIIHKLLALPRSSSAIESHPSDHSLFWSYYSEGSMITLIQAGAIITGTSNAWKGGHTGDLNDEGKEGVAKYSGWLLVSLSSSSWGGVEIVIAAYAVKIRTMSSSRRTR